MKKFFSVFLAGLMLMGCSTATSNGAPQATADAAGSAQPEVEITQEQVDEAAELVLKVVESAKALDGSDLKILSPSGAPALSLIPAEIGGLSTEFVDGADPLQAAMVNPSPEYDVIIAPSNLGMKLAEAGKSSYKMLAAVTWGNLYMVGGKDAGNEPAKWEKVAAFGEQSVTGLVFRSVYGEQINMDNVTWYSSTAEASAALLAGEADVAMLAEPNATAAIGKGKENGKEFAILDDLQARYSNSENGGFPQAAMFVKEASYADKKDQIEALYNLMKMFSDTMASLPADAIVSVIDSAGGAQKYGIPSSEVAGKVWSRLHINPAKASEHKEELSRFGELFSITDIDSCLIG